MNRSSLYGQRTGELSRQKKYHGQRSEKANDGVWLEHISACEDGR